MCCVIFPLEVHIESSYIYPYARNVLGAAVYQSCPILTEKLVAGGNILHALWSPEGKAFSKTEHYQGHKGKIPWDPLNFIQINLLLSLRLH